MKRIYKYLSAFVFTGILAMALTGSVYAQRGGHGGGGHGGGGHGGGGGFHGASGGGFRSSGGGGFHGSSSVRGRSSGFHGSSSFRSSSSGFRGAAVNRGSARFRGNTGFRGAAGFRGNAGFHGATAYRGGARGNVYARGGRYTYGGRTYYRGGYGYRGYGYRGYGYHGYGGFRFGLGWGYPHFGLYFGALPFGYYPFYWDSSPYYYSGGVFYRPYNGGYQVTAPPIGAAVPTLPSNAQSIVIDGIQYYEAAGVYYEATVDDNGKTVYVVAGKDGVLSTDNGGGDVGDQPAASNEDPIDNAPVNGNTQVQSTPQANVAAVAKVGDIVDQLPPDCKKVTLNKKIFYVSPDNVFFEDYKDADGAGYRVASVPPQGDGQ
ncbi:MAG: DUF6515 family protein [Sphingobacteriales bacterium]